MSAVDYIAERGIEAASADWEAQVRPYLRSSRPTGDPQHSVLVVVDLQEYFCHPESPAFLPASRHVLPRVQALASRFRAAGSPVVFTRHALAAGEDPGRMADWWRHLVHDGHRWGALAPDAGVAAADHVVRKSRYDAFEGTELRRWLAEMGIDTVVIAGVMTHLCCESTARAAFASGLHVWVSLDATASAQEELHVGALRILAHGFATVAPSARIIAWREAASAVVPTRSEEPAPARGSPEPSEHVAIVTDARHAEPRASAPQPRRMGPSAPVDLLVVGGGPAGLAASCQAIRQGLDVALVEADRPGGLLHEADWVENLPTVSPQTGAHLGRRLVEWARAQGVTIVPARGEELIVEEDGLELRLAAPDHPPSIRARAVVVATGTAPRRAGFAGEQQHAGSRVFYGISQMRQAWAGRRPGRALIVGGGDAAFDQGIGLLRAGWRIELAIRGRAPRALALLQRRLAALGGTVRSETKVESLQEHGGDSSVCLRGPCGEHRLPFDGVLVAVGRSPRPLAVQDRRGRSDAAPMVAYAGDVARGESRQCAIAMGDGTAAAMELARRMAGLAGGAGPPCSPASARVNLGATS